jgi:hypothetical protein
MNIKPSPIKLEFPLLKKYLGQDGVGNSNIAAQEKEHNV